MVVRWMYRYTKMGFAGNVEPCFIIPTVVAVNESFLGQAASQKTGTAAYHSAGVMADLDFFIGEEALAKQHASAYTLSYPIRQGQVYPLAIIQIVFSLLLAECTVLYVWV